MLEGKILVRLPSPSPLFWRGFAPLVLRVEAPPPSPVRFDLVRGSRLAVLNQVLVRNRPKFILKIYIFFLLRFFGEVKNLFFSRETYFYFVLNIFITLYLLINFLVSFEKKGEYAICISSSRTDHLLHSYHS